MHTQTDVLTNLDFLNEGQPWPPTSQINRLNRYALHKSKFSNTTTYNKDAYKTIINLVDDSFRVITFRITANLYRKVTYRTADLLFVERPKYFAGEVDSNGKNAQQEALNEIVLSSKLGKRGYQGAMDISIFGDSIYAVEIDGQEGEVEGAAVNKGHIEIVAPRYWFPVVSEINVSKIQFHVMAFVVTRTTKVSDGEDVLKKVLVYQVHESGSYKQFERNIKEDDTLGELIPTEDREEFILVETELSDFAIVPIQGVVTSDGIYGIDDYTDLISLIDELQIRLEQTSHVLDKHADPSMSGPASALSKDEKTGEYTVKLSGYFQRDNTDDPNVEYITWDGKLDSSWEQIEIILNLISVISEMGAAILERDSDSSAESGVALKLRFVSPLTKVSRFRNSFDDGFKLALSLASEVGYGEGGKMTQSEISIVWQDGLPNDPKEDAEIGQLRTNKPTDTVVAQIMKQDGLTEEEAIKKAEEIAIAEIAGATAGGFGDTMGLSGIGQAPEENSEGIVTRVMNAIRNR